MGKRRVLLGVKLTHYRSRSGSKVYDLKPFNGGQKNTFLGATTFNKVIGLMTLNRSMDGKAFSVFVEQFLVPNLWKGAGEYVTFVVSNYTYKVFS